MAALPVIGNPNTDTLAEVLKVFDIEELKPQQHELIMASLAGSNVLGILPTGYGKSACYQIPGIVLGVHTIVVSPLIALQEDQVRALRARGIAAFAVHSNMEHIKRMAAVLFYRMNRTQASFLYISPEMLLSQWFMEQFGSVAFQRIAIDEAHCVSTWGSAFRPEYQRISLAVKRLGIPHCSAFTATIDEQIEKDIRQRLPLGDDVFRVEASPIRPNLSLSIEYGKQVRSLKTPAAQKKLKRFYALLGDSEYEGPAIVYMTSRNGAAVLFEAFRKSNFARAHGMRPLLFHAELPYSDKEMAIRAFQNEAKPVVFATTAFGLGIDRPDVRQIIHYDVPYTAIDYAQQIGRGGRDGKPTLCTVFYDPQAYLERETARVARDVPSIEFVERVLKNLRTTLKRVLPASRPTYSLNAFMTRLQIFVNNNEEINSKGQYMQKVSNSLAILQRAGIVHTSADGLTALPLIPGTPPHRKVLEETQMQQRMLVREKQRLDTFFGTEGADQTLLWEIIRAP